MNARINIKQDNNNDNDINLKNNRTFEFRPSIKIEIMRAGISILISLVVIFLITTLIYIYTDAIESLMTIPIFLGVIIFMAIFGSISQIVSLLITKYTISKDNELIITQNFLSKTSKVYRIDQITSVERTQGWIQKMFNLHTVRFNIFGGSSPIAQNQQTGVLFPVFKNITNGNDIYQEILSRMNVSSQKSQYKTRPNAFPKLIGIFINIFFLIVTILVSILSANYFSSTEVTIGGIIATLIVLLILFGNCVDYIKLKRTFYNLYEDSTSLSYTYFFKNAEHTTPFRKITNVSRYKSLIQYTLFKISNIRLYTGGERDQMFTKVLSSSPMFEIFSYLVKDKKNVLNKNIVSSIKSNEEKPMKSLKPGLSFIIEPLISTIIYSTIFIVSLIIAYNFVDEVMIRNLILSSGVIGILIGILKLTIRFIQWKNFKYDLFTDKIVITYGVLSIVSSEIYIANMKYVSLNIPFYLQRVLGEGSISIYTAGKNSRDGILQRIPNAQYYYEQLEEAIHSSE